MGRAGCSTLGSSNGPSPLPTGFSAWPAPPKALAYVSGMRVNGAGSVAASPSAPVVQTRGPCTTSVFDHAPTAKRTGHDRAGRPPGGWQAPRSSTSARGLKSAKSPG